MPFWEKPKTDNQRLLTLFRQWRLGDKKAMDRAYMLLAEIALKNINLQCKRNRKLAGLSPYERREKAHNAATYLVRQFLSRQDFYIKKSAVAYLYKNVQYELFYHRKVDKIVDFVDFSEWNI